MLLPGQQCWWQTHDPAVAPVTLCHWNSSGAVCVAVSGTPRAAQCWSPDLIHRPDHHHPSPRRCSPLAPLGLGSLKSNGESIPHAGLRKCEPPSFPMLCSWLLGSCLHLYIRKCPPLTQSLSSKSVLRDSNTQGTAPGNELASIRKY